jgi:hypothetical protein
MADKEAEVVTEDFVKRPDTYNMHKGGWVRDPTDKEPK